MMALPNSLRADAERIWQAAIGAVDPQSLLAVAPAELLGPLPAGRIVVVGAGKAAAGMAAGVEELLAAAEFPTARLSGLVSVPEGCGRNLASIEVRQTRPPGINLPTDRVVTATAAMLASLGRRWQRRATASRSTTRSPSPASFPPRVPASAR